MYACTYGSFAISSLARAPSFTSHSVSCTFSVSRTAARKISSYPCPDRFPWQFSRTLVPRLEAACCFRDILRWHCASVRPAHSRRSARICTLTNLPHFSCSPVSQLISRFFQFFWIGFSFPVSALLILPVLPFLLF